MLERFDPLHRRPEQLFDPCEAFARTRLRDLEYSCLCLVQQLIRCELTLVGLLDDYRRDLDQPPAQRLFFYDLRVVIDVRGRRDDVDEKAHIVLAARGLQLGAPRELLRERQRIDDAAALGDRDHRAEDSPMTLRVEHRVVHGFRRAEHRVLIHEHRREHGLLGVLGIRGTTIAIGITCR